MAGREPALILKKDKEKSLLKKHPWIFSGAVGRILGEPGAGDTVRISSAGGEFLAWGAFSPESQIRARVWSFRESERIDGVFFRARLEAAAGRRRAAGFEEAGTNAYRLVHGESDGLPGLIVDKYAGCLAVQFLFTGVEKNRDLILEGLESLFPGLPVWERSDTEARMREGLPPRSGLLCGPPVPDRVEIMENGLKFLVDVKEGQKTGFFLDQRDARNALRGFTRGARVLDCFSYTGGFTVSALAGGAAAVTAVDSSAKALGMIADNVAANGFDPAACELVRGDSFEELRRFTVEKRKFDVVVLDPPKLASRKEHLKKAERAYKDANLLALKALAPGGVLFTFSCSGAVGREDFFKIVAWAALDAGAGAAVIGALGQPADHPVALSFPQSEYLKGLIVRV